MLAYDEKQYGKAKEKLLWMAEHCPELMQLDPPADRDAVAALEREQGIALPGDYKAIITDVAAGGFLPAFLEQRYWRDLWLSGKNIRLGQPYPPAEQLTSGGRQSVPVEEPDKLPGQFLLMGDGKLGWSLVTAGPCAGEVWTIGEFGAVRVPGCTFTQWLELVLDGALPEYIRYCFTGMEGPAPVWKVLLDLLSIGPVWKEEPARKCQRWLDRHRRPIPKEGRSPKEEPKDDFVYVGPSPDVWAGWVKNRLEGALRPLPQEQSAALKKLRAAQASPRWKWGRPRPEADKDLPRELREALGGELDRVYWEDPEEMRLLARLVREYDTLDRSALSDHEQFLLKTAKELRGKEFQARGVGIRDLSFVEGLTGLRRLDLWDNDIEDLSPLASLTGLKELSIPFNLISDLSPLAGLSGLAKLRATGNKIASLEPLRGLTSLHDLDLRGNPLEPGALACLRKCKRLGMVDLSYTGLGDISGLEFCRAHILELYGNPDLTGVEVISTMKRLCCLYIDTEVAHRYDIQALAPQFIEYGELGGISMYTWPEKYYN